MALARVAFLLLCLCSIASMAQAETCTIMEKFYCVPGNGCKAVKSTAPTWSLHGASP
jgi:hypothetical protein